MIALRAHLSAGRWHTVVLNVFADNDVGDLLRNRINLELPDQAGYCYTAPSSWDRWVLLKALRSTLYQVAGLWPRGATLASRDHLQCVEPWLPGPGAHNPVHVLQARAQHDVQVFDAAATQVFYDDRYDIELACGQHTAATRWQARQLGAVFAQFQALALQHGLTRSCRFSRRNTT